MDDQKLRDTANLALDRYKSISGKLLGWLIVYGVSIAALFITQAATFSNFTTRTKLFVLIPAFLGVALQLFLVLVLKYINLITFKAHFPEEPLAMDSKWHKCAKWLAEAFGIDIVFDIITVVAYGVATTVLISSLVAE